MTIEKTSRNLHCRPEIPSVKWVAVAVLLLAVSAGCTATKGASRAEGEGFDMNSAVKSRAARLEELSDSADMFSPVLLGRARALLGEMEYFRSERNAAEVRRLDGRISVVLDRLQRDINAGAGSGGKGSRVDIRRLRSELARATKERDAARDELDLVNGTRKIETQSFEMSMKTVITARDEAIREVVRARSRIQGMASQTEAAAMFAEARVIVDRMSEEAYNVQSREYLKQARVYLADGRQELDGGNPGGAAYLFDLISTLYQNFQGMDPRKLIVIVKGASLRKKPTISSERIGILGLGDEVQGLQKGDGWFMVSTASRQRGWINVNLVR
ncbi:MAG: SH3 domain-containing protein [bacterium]|nr:MAG: SH3 domain-containing protein [bacterium]